jgi:hypothetical protein
VPLGLLPLGLPLLELLPLGLPLLELLPLVPLGLLLVFLPSCSYNLPSQERLKKRPQV